VVAPVCKIYIAFPGRPNRERQASRWMRRIKNRGERHFFKGRLWGRNLQDVDGDIFNSFQYTKAS
jgi:hypothetical protein